MPDNPRIEPLPVPNCYATNAFLQAPGRMFWESPGRVRRSGAARPPLLACQVIAFKANHGIHPAALGYSAAAIAAMWPDAPESAYYAGINPTARFAHHNIIGALDGRPRHSNTAVGGTGIPTTDIYWELAYYDNPPPGWTLDYTWMRKRTDFAADFFTNVSADGALNYAWTRDDGATTSSESGEIGPEREPVACYDAVKNYVEGYGGPVLSQFTSGNGRQRLANARDFYPATGFRNQVTDANGRLAYNGYTSGFDFSSYDGAFDAPGFTNEFGTQPNNSWIISGWSYSTGGNSGVGQSQQTGIAATRSSLKLPPLYGSLRLLFLLTERDFGSNVDSVTPVGDYLLQPGETFDYIGRGGKIPNFMKFKSYRWIVAVAG